MDFKRNKPVLSTQYTDTHWDPTSGLEPAALEQAVLALEKELCGHTKAYIKAQTFALLCQKGQLAVLPEDIFQEKLNARGIMQRQRDRWWRDALPHFVEERRIVEKAAVARAYTADPDFGHTAPDTMALVQLGLPGLAARLAKAKEAHVCLTAEQEDFYASAQIMLQAIMDYCLRLSQVEGISDENKTALAHLATKAPANLYEAMQLMVIYFYLHEYIAGTRVRTLGRLDVVFYPLYQKGLANGTLTPEDATELWKYFLFKLWTMQVPFDLPFCIGGLGLDGEEVTNELSYRIVEAYDAIDIYSPKIHVRVSPKTPASFVKRILRCIRDGNSSFVFVNDTVALRAMEKCGIPEVEARNYVPVGCYEPGIWGTELPCTGNGWLSLPKALEYVFTRGKDFFTGEQIGLDTGTITSYDELIEAVKKQIAYLVDQALMHITNVEKYYMDIGPDPLLSATMLPCVESGIDAYAGGARYNNSSFYMHSIATLADSLAAVRRLVFTEKRFSFAELREILQNDWQGQEKLRLEVLASPEKYGNNIDSVDAIAVELADFTAAQINGRANGRGGIFKSANFTIDTCFPNGKKTMATPDGRHTGEPNSKNLCAVTAMDKNGITALIQSVTKMDHSDFPNGSVLDFVLHPSAVSGEDGLEAFYGILMTYFHKGGFALHGNVFCAEDLKKAQAEPEKYATLQVRVCGWNVYFVNLSKVEQDAFIRQAENQANV